LRQLSAAAAARQADQAAWDATDKNRRASLQDYLSRYPNGPHAQDARSSIAGIDKQEADALLVNQRVKEQKDKDQEAANRQATEHQAITQTISDFEGAYNRRDLKSLQALYSGLQKSVGDQFKDARTLSFQLRPMGQPVVSGDSATVTCTRTLDVTFKTIPRQPPVSERVLVTLVRAGAKWVIRAIDKI
jgi:hypothetical protein